LHGPKPHYCIIQISDVDMREAAHNGCNGADGGSSAVVVDCGVAGTSFVIVKLECGHSTVLEEVRLRQCWV
jgi:hypothetical protein